MTVRQTTKEIILQSLPVIVGVLVFSVITGNRLEESAELVTKEVPVLLVLLPAFINISGDLADVFSSRLTSELYRGRLDKNFRPFKIYLTDLFSILAVSLSAFVFAAFIGNLVTGYLFHKTSPWGRLIFVVLFAGLIATTLMSLIATLIVRWSYLRGIDADSVTSPINTTGGDMIGTTLLLFLAQLLLT